MWTVIFILMAFVFGVGTGACLAVYYFAIHRDVLATEMAHHDRERESI